MTLCCEIDLGLFPPDNTIGALLTQLVQVHAMLMPAQA